MHDSLNRGYRARSAASLILGCCCLAALQTPSHGRPQPQAKAIRIISPAPKELAGTDVEQISVGCRALAWSWILVFLAANVWMQCKAEEWHQPLLWFASMYSNLVVLVFPLYAMGVDDGLAGGLSHMLGGIRGGEGLMANMALLLDNKDAILTWVQPTVMPLERFGLAAALIVLEEYLVGRTMAPEAWLRRTFRGVVEVAVFCGVAATAVWYLLRVPSCAGPAGSVVNIINLIWLVCTSCSGALCAVIVLFPFIMGKQVFNAWVDGESAAVRIGFTVAYVFLLLVLFYILRRIFRWLFRPRRKA